MNKYKVGCVAKVYHKQFSFDFNEKNSPIVKPAPIRVIITFSLTNKWQLRQIDINNVLWMAPFNKRFICPNHLVLKNKITLWFVRWIKLYIELNRLQELVWNIFSSTNSVWLHSLQMWPLSIHLLSSRHHRVWFGLCWWHPFYRVLFISLFYY